MTMKVEVDKWISAHILRESDDRVLRHVVRQMLGEWAEKALELKALQLSRMTKFSSFDERFTLTGFLNGEVGNAISDGPITKGDRVWIDGFGWSLVLGVDVGSTHPVTAYTMDGVKIMAKPTVVHPFQLTEYDGYITNTMKAKQVLLVFEGDVIRCH